MLANSDLIKFGYVSRASVRNSAQHMILGTQQQKPSEFAQNISLNMENCWGVLRCLIDRSVFLEDLQITTFHKCQIGIYCFCKSSGRIMA